MKTFYFINQKMEALRMLGAVMYFETQEGAEAYLLKMGYIKWKTFKSGKRKGLTEYRLDNYKYYIKQIGV